MAQEEKRNKADLKVVMLGPQGVGKTCVVNRYFHDTFSNDEMSTIGASFGMISWGTKHAALWDTAGQERWAGLTSFYCRNAGAAVLCYDITDAETFERMKVKFYPLLQNEPNCVKVVVGCKEDLIDLKRPSDGLSPGKSEFYAREVPTQSALDFAKEINPNFRSVDEIRSVPFFETSSKTGGRVKEVFQFILHQVLGEPDGPVGPATAEQELGTKDVTIKLQPNSPPQKKKCKC